jgi:hypothetical protein
MACPRMLWLIFVVDEDRADRLAVDLVFVLEGHGDRHHELEPTAVEGRGRQAARAFADVPRADYLLGSS